MTELGWDDWLCSGIGGFTASPILCANQINLTAKEDANLEEQREEDVTHSDRCH